MDPVSTSNPHGLALTTQYQYDNRSRLIKMKCLWIELSSEHLNLLFVDSMGSAHKSLSYAKVLQIEAAVTAKISRQSLVHLSQP